MTSLYCEISSLFGTNDDFSFMSIFLRPFLSRLKMTTPIVNTKETRMIWFDGEFTGLEVETQRIAEVAAIVTEADLTEVATYGPVVINQSQDILENVMSKWCKRTFKKNGLLEKIKESKITEEQVETELLEFLKEHTPHFTCPLAGNSVNIDRLFIDKYLPTVGQHLHYRTIDVSTIKEVWF
ncbi:Oligoribonuclease family protein [Aphelenchoides bicaudatus]|nr:Oligoribonuclease family protein [Aphelenchoides bicaudatus]